MRSGVVSTGINVAALLLLVVGAIGIGVVWIGPISAAESHRYSAEEPSGDWLFVKSRDRLAI